MEADRTESSSRQPVETESPDQDDFESVSSSVDEFDMLRKLLVSVKDVAGENVDHFGSVPNFNQSHERFHTLFTNIVTSTESMELLCEPIMQRAAEFDSDPMTHANGFRSLLQMVAAVANGLSTQSKLCKENCTKTFFSSGATYESLSALAGALKGLSHLVLLAGDLLLELEDGNLFPKSNAKSEEFLARSQTIPRECFYGQCLGVHVSIWAFLLCSISTIFVPG